LRFSALSQLLFFGFTMTSTALTVSGCQGMHGVTESLAIPQTSSRSVPVPVPKDRLHILHAFDPAHSNDDGGTPIGGLIEVKGKFFGTTWTGGALHGWGTVFEIDSAGHEHTIYRFLGGYSYMDGGNPYAGLTAMGDLMYGTTFAGGADNNNGTVFSLTPSGSESVIHSFGANGDGYKPAGRLLAYKGILYGTTTYGGHSKDCSSYCGTIFSTSPSGSERVIHNFSSKDGARPYGGLISVHGTLYGTTELGGRGHPYGRGTVYAISPSGTFKTLHVFGTNSGDGASPYGTLLFTRNALYGTTSAGGAHNAGTIFKIGLDGSESVLYSFTGYLDGARPEGGLITVNGKLLGTTSGGGGGCGCGTIFAIDFDGNEKTLHVLDEIHDGEYPMDTLLYLSGGLYGTAYTGGAHQFGTVFRLPYPK
jgi:uncharacterized repeat protein (TIGR03803 family)